MNSDHSKNRWPASAQLGRYHPLAAGIQVHSNASSKPKIARDLADPELKVRQSKRAHWVLAGLALAALRIVARSLNI